MKTGVIAELLQLPLKESIALAARLGAEGVQLHALHPQHDLTAYKPAELKALKAFCDDHGLAVSAICGDLPGHGFRIAEENPAKIDKEKRVIDLLPELGCRIVTTHIGVIPEDTSRREYATLLAAMSELGDYAAAAGAVIAIETGPETPETLSRFIEATGSKGVGVNLDPANLLMVLNADPVQAVHTLGRHIVHTHVKDGIHYRPCDPEKVYAAFAEGGFEQLVAETGELFAEVPPGKGSVQWPQYLDALRQSGFDGFLTIEREVGANPAQDIAEAIAFIRKELAAL